MDMMMCHPVRQGTKVLIRKWSSWPRLLSRWLYRDLADSKSNPSTVSPPQFQKVSLINQPLDVVMIDIPSDNVVFLNKDRLCFSSQLSDTDFGADRTPSTRKLLRRRRTPRLAWSQAGKNVYIPRILTSHYHLLPILSYLSYSVFLRCLLSLF